MNRFLFRISFCLAFVFFGQGLVASDKSYDALMGSAKDQSTDFEAALAAAEEEGLATDWLLEARIVRQLSTGNFEELLALLPEVDQAGDDFRFGIGRTFISRMQLEGFADALRCIKAYQAGDYDQFVDYAVASYRKAPYFNQAFGIGELLNRYRYEQVQELAMQDFSVPMDMKLANVEGETRTLSEWMEGKDYMLVDFWASWCSPCIRLMPSLREKATSLSEQGVFVAGINTDRDDQLNNAVKVRERQEMQDVPWLLDSNGGDLSGLLMVDSIPRMVLLDPEGKVLYNGHPADPALGEALAEVGVALAGH